MRMGKRLYALVMFILVSMVGGLLMAGFIVPAAGLAAETGTAVARVLDSIPAELETPPQSERSKILMSDGSELGYFFDENRTYVPLADIAPIMRTAQIAIEDHRFYQHGAVDLIGTIRALVRTTTGTVQGGSTLTLQYVKLVLISTAQEQGDTAAVAQVTGRSLAQKVRELRYAAALEQELTKDEILERYLNMAYYGDGAYGVEAAARHYFGTTAKNLTLGQAALLAGLVQNPTTTDPINHPKLALERRNTVLARMVDLNLITAEQSAAAKVEGFDATKVQRNLRGCANSRYPFVCDLIERTLLDSPGLGPDRETRKNVLYRGGLVIHTPINPKIQDAAESSIQDFLKATDPVISVSITMEPGTGLIYSMAQNRTRMGTAPGETYFNYAVTRNMGGAEGYQGGSTFKAFTVAAAIEKGFPVSRSYNSQSPMDFTGQVFTSCEGRFKASSWQVKNASPSGVFTMLQGAKFSVNTYMVQLERDVGLCNVTKMAERLGLKSSMGENLVQKYQWIPAFTLGTVEVTPLSVLEAYSTFGARGMHCDPVIVQSIATKAGKALATPNGNCQQVIPPELADAVSSVLRGPFEPGGTANPARPNATIDIAGKTGTVDDAAAIWTVGYTPQLAGVGMIAVDRVDPFWAKHPNSLQGVSLPSGQWLGGASGSEAGRMIFRPAFVAAMEGKTFTKFVDPPADLVNGKRVPVPTCSGLSLEACQAVLEAAGFSVVTVSQDSSQPAGTFLGMSPTGTAAQYSTITLLVSSGNAPPPPETLAPTDPATGPKGKPSPSPTPTATSTRRV